MVEAVFKIEDYEIFGTGAQRKKYWQDLSKNGPIILLRHDWTFLRGIEEHTLEWLKPQRIQHSVMPAKKALLEKKAHEIFPLTLGRLQEMQSKILDDYERELPWQEGLLDDHFRYFSVFLKKRFPLEAELSQWEWVRHFLSYQDFSTLAPSKSLLPVLRPNPSLQIIEADLVAPILGIEPGLYALAYQSQKNSIVETQLSIRDAEILDLLEDDRETTLEQIELSLSESGKTREEIQKDIQVLVKNEILI